jgi:osmoprotectant transport system substrate-binding protein
VLLLAGCGRSNRLVVGSKNFTEQLILGEIVAQHVENRLGHKVERRLNLGGTLLAHTALLRGEIDLYPEYTGTALTAILKLPPDPDAAAVLKRVRDSYHEWGIEWLDPLGFNDTFAMVVRGEDARRWRLRTLTDAGRRKWTLGVGYEFAQRPDGLPGLEKVYGLPLAGPPKTMDLGLLYQALEQKQIDMAAGNATDGLIAARDLTVLEDDRHFFPPYQAALAARSAVLTPQLRNVLLELSGRFTDQSMRRLNYEVAGRHRSVAEVAKEFLTSGFRARPVLR